MTFDSVVRVVLRYHGDQSDRVPPEAMFICLIAVRRAAAAIGRRHLSTPTNASLADTKSSGFFLLAKTLLVQLISRYTVNVNL